MGTIVFNETGVFSSVALLFGRQKDKKQSSPSRRSVAVKVYNNMEVDDGRIIIFYC